MRQEVYSYLSTTFIFTKIAVLSKRERHFAGVELRFARERASLGSSAFREEHQLKIALEKIKDKKKASIKKIASSLRNFTDCILIRIEVGSTHVNFGRAWLNRTCKVLSNFIYSLDEGYDPEPRTASVSH